MMLPHRNHDRTRSLSPAVVNVTHCRRRLRRRDPPPGGPGHTHIRPQARATSPNVGSRRERSPVADHRGHAIESGRAFAKNTSRRDTCAVKIPEYTREVRYHPSAQMRDRPKTQPRDHFSAQTRDRPKHSRAMTPKHRPLRRGSAVPVCINHTINRVRWQQSAPPSILLNLSSKKIHRLSPCLRSHPHRYRTRCPALGSHAA